MAKELKIRITGDASGLKKGADDAEGILSGFGSKMSAWSVATGTLIADGLKTGVKAIGGFIGDSIGSASDMNETLSKVGVLFGDSAGAVEDFAKSSAIQFGQSKQQALDAAATFATFGKGAGLAGQDLATFSTDFVGLASDMASFGNTSTDQAIEAIGAALRGEAEPIRAYGVLLDDATLRQKALELGIISTTKNSLTPQQKVLAAQAAIYEQTGAAQGDFARTSDGLANQQRILSAQFANLKTTVGQAFLPVVLDLVKVVNTKVIPVLEKWGPILVDGIAAGIASVVAWGHKLVDLFQTGGWTAAAGEIGSKIKDGLVVAGEWLLNTGLPFIGGILENLGRRFGTWVTDIAVPYLQANLPIWLAALGDWLTGTALPWLGDQTLELAKKLGGWIGDAAVFLLANLPGWIATFEVWWYGTAVPWLAVKLWDMSKQMGEWIVDAAQFLGENLPIWGKKFDDWMTGTALPAIREKMLEAAKALGAWVIDAAAELARNLPGYLMRFNSWVITEALPAIARFGGQATQAMANAAAGLAGVLVDVGVDMVWGLIHGIGSMAGQLNSAVSNLIGSIPAAARNLLGIGSPSKVFHEIGLYTAQGLAGGLTAGQGMVASAAGRMAGAAFADVPFGSGRGYSPADLSGGSQVAGWQQTKIQTVVQINGRNVVTATEPDQIVLERSRR